MAALARGELDAAEAAFEQARRREPKRLDPVLGLFDIAVKRGDARTAARHLESARAIAPNNIAVETATGRLQFLEKRFADAETTLRKVVQENPKLALPRLWLGDVLLAEGKEGQALSEYQRVQTAAPKFADPHVRIGMIHERNQRLPEAEQSYTTAIRLDPFQAIPYNNLAWLASQRNVRLDQAVEWAKKAVELAPQEPAYWDTLGWVYRARGDFDKAIQVLSKAAEMKPLYPDVLYHLGVACFQAGRPQEAKAALTKALALKQDFPDADDARRLLANLSRSNPR